MIVQVEDSQFEIQRQTRKPDLFRYNTQHGYKTIPHEIQRFQQNYTHTLIYILDKDVYKITQNILTFKSQNFQIESTLICVNCKGICPDYQNLSPMLENFCSVCLQQNSNHIETDIQHDLKNDYQDDYQQDETSLEIVPPQLDLKIRKEKKLESYEESEHQEHDALVIPSDGRDDYKEFKIPEDFDFVCQFCDCEKLQDKFSSCINKCLCDKCAIEILYSDDFYGRCPICEELLNCSVLPEND